MQIYGFDSIRSEIQSGGYTVKLLANDRTAAFFPRTVEHREVKIGGLDYKDDSKGNALAAMMSPGRIEFRHHRAFSDTRVKQIALELVKHADLNFAREFQILYQGRLLT